MMNKLLSDSDWDSYSGSSESENQDDLESVYTGHLQSVFSSLEESIGRIDDLLAFERGFLPGDIVCYVEHPCGQIGHVVDVDMTVDLETLSGEIIQAVNSKNLTKFCFFSLGDHVVSGPWLGKVVQVVYLVTVLLDDGTKCEICTEDPELLIPVALNMIEDAQHPYYPGQRVRIRSPNVFKCVSWKAKQDEGTVCHVEVGLVHVNWITSGVIGQDFSEPTPPSLQDPKDLTSLSYFSHANWQVGDWCLIRYDDYDNHELGVKEQIPPNIFSHSPSRLVRKSDGGVQRRNPHCEQICLVAKTKSKVNVLWQDGNYSIGLDSQTLAPVDNVGDHEFLPEQFVIERGTYDNKSVSSGQRMGIVKRVDAKERTVLVKWASCDLNGANGSNTEFSEEIWSAYELIEHPEYSYCMGDIVIKVMDNFENLKRNFPFIQTNGLNHTSKETTTMDGVNGTLGKKLTGECQDHISCIGIVTGIKDGAIEVKWATGLISKVGPYEIFGIDRHEDTASQGETMDVHGSQDRLEYAEQSPWLKKEKGVLEKAVNGFKEECKKDLWEATALSLPLAAIGFLTSVAKSLFCSHGTISTASTSFAKLNKSYPDFEDLLSTSDDSHILRQPDLRLQGKDIQEKEELPLASGIETFGSFKQFDTVTDYADHHFVIGVSNKSMLSQVKREWLKKVNQEWNILEKNLPDSIFVRVYEERMDLMRAAIVGSSGTPYHDGLFLFDIVIPSDYPNEPPMVHYNSGGLRLNPNLYESGKVCLSLLNTWTGVDTEMWNPDKSTVLQILLSLQALVLNERPYFNEAGYHKQIGRVEGEKNSQTYNENAFLLSCKSMLYLLHKPPKNFEALVKEHFKQRSHSILSACKAYMDGVQVGCAFEAGQVSGKSQWSNSTGFKIMLAKLIPMLISAFNEIGVDCHRFLEEKNGILEMD